MSSVEGLPDDPYEWASPMSTDTFDRYDVTIGGFS